jgi:hypothetical protein
MGKIIPRITHNKVLIYPDADFNKIGELELNDEFDPQYHVPIMGEVLQVPDRLFYFGDKIAELKAGIYHTKNRNNPIQYLIRILNNNSTLEDTKMEVEIGDKVVFGYVYHQENKESGQFVDVGRTRPALLVPYSELIMAIRGVGGLYDERIMLNGYMWVKPAEYTQEEANALIGGLHNDLKDTRKGNKGTVVEAGNPVPAYLNYPNVADDARIQVGTEVDFPKGMGVAVEWDYHKKLNKGNYPYYKLQRKDVITFYP